MSRARPHLTGIERTFGDDEVIVSKTDCKGFITYANEVFQRVAGYTEAELLGEPHSIVRHPDMPRCVFKFLWDTIRGGNEIFAYVLNRAKNGDHYWVLAHVTPTRDDRGVIVGYHSNRRLPSPKAVDFAAGLYKQLCAEEARHEHPLKSVEASMALLLKTLNTHGVSYEELVFQLLANESTADGKSSARTRPANTDRSTRPLRSGVEPFRPRIKQPADRGPAEPPRIGTLRK